MLRAALFTLVGCAFLAHWLVTHPSFDQTERQQEWPHVLAFSAVLLLLAVALPAFAVVAGGRTAFRAALAAGSGAALSSVANVVEDGLRQDWAFFGFVAGTVVHLVGLLALAAVLGLGRRRTARLLALVPLGTLASIIVYVDAGGPLMLATWLVAAAVALRLPAPAAAKARVPSAA